jgi:hypothetical protein
MSGPSQNAGKMAQAMKATRALLSGMAGTLMLAGPSTPLGQALNKAIMDIGKHVPPDPGPNDTFRQMAQREGQMAPHAAALQAAVPKPAAPPSAPPMAA